MNKNTFFKYTFYPCLLLCLISLSCFGQITTKDFVVVLDAGHGGKDTGNRGNGYLEKKIALTIALEIGKQLSSQKGIKVIYTRKDDRFVELKNRAKIANQADADLFISIHCDAFTSPQAYGAGTFVLGLHRNKDNFRIAQNENSVIFLEEDHETTYEGFDPNNPESVISLVLMQETYNSQSIDAANTIQRSFVTNLKRKDRTVKQAGFLVLRETYMPSVLVEVGFLTNKNEGAYLNSTSGQREMATTISKAIINYKKQLEASVVKEDQAVIVTEKETPEKKENPVKAIDANGIIFKVQIAAISKSIDLSRKNFKGLTNLSKEKSGNLYRYFYGQTDSYDQAEKLKKKAIKKGYEHAFLVAYKDGVKIKISEAISTK
ncbi:N-acetylmuramoyl-L-alanine amidase [Flavobacteriaceae bacterium]|nr:N-acetylmuramoyl-L-alanine amidase [Flavobacteriaceae bacterium]